MEKEKIQFIKIFFLKKNIEKQKLKGYFSDFFYNFFNIFNFFKKIYRNKLEKGKRKKEKGKRKKN